MNEYAELRQRQQAEFNALPLGFAFSRKQFDEMMEGWGLDTEKDLDKILRVPGGGYVQKKDAGLLHQTAERHDAEMTAAIAGDVTGEGFIYQIGSNNCHSGVCQIRPVGRKCGRSRKRVYWVHCCHSCTRP